MVAEVVEKERFEKERLADSFDDFWKHLGVATAVFWKQRLESARLAQEEGTKTKPLAMARVDFDMDVRAPEVVASLERPVEAAFKKATEGGRLRHRRLERQDDGEGRGPNSTSDNGCVDDR